ncbi:uncharacterized protein LTR77_010040 [Saxophila tyrrhenica]|uniref:Heterokaryon incompatibility domain-containing protein n=1 Tax=Saxophila tyrrhenica TaxID=1690608 RepID=A0AAV9NYI1_9PEZI|nr:hypothetical protein LTR77_010040 [Saxophila tyrrhenica]
MIRYIAHTYNYRPLDVGKQEIRILSISPQRLDDQSPLQGHLQHVSLLHDNIEKIIPISYVWGSPNDKKKLLIDGLPLDIPASADITLRHFVHYLNYGPGKDDTKELSKRPFWLDSVCINQGDFGERAQQVRLMKDIYSDAALTFIWLGEDTDLTAELGAQALRNYYKRDDDVDDWTSSILTVSWEERKALSTFFTSPWYERTWTLQEAVLPSDVWFFKGLHAVDWAVINCFAPTRHLSLLLPGELGWTKEQEQGFHDAGMIFEIDLLGGKRIENRLPLTAHLKSTDPLDKVYGLLGMLETSIPDGVTVDYRLPAATVFAAATRSAVARKEGIVILRETLIRVPPVVDLVGGKFPSWAVRCHWKRRYRQLIPSSCIKLPAICHDNYGYVDVGDPNVIRVRGVSWGVIQHDPVQIVNNPTHCFPATSRRSVNARSLRAIWDAAWSTTPQNEVECLPERTWNVITRGTVVMEYTRSNKAFKVMLDRRHESVAWEEPVPDDVIKDSAHPALEQILEKGRERSFVVADSGLLGAAWHTVKGGDSIVMIFGCDIPLVLRPDGDRWVSIGDVYVYDAMAGEPVVELEKRGQLDEQMQWFDIH